MRILIILVFVLFTTSSFAATFEGKFTQGSFILGKTEPGSEVFVDKKKVRVTSDGYFAFGLGR
ncbi:M23 family peptidase, partial [Pelagibacteraceae bacterium]|nr:M23 family peptidase [Pelagibacteraceae bacterium]